MSWVDSVKNVVCNDISSFKLPSFFKHFIKFIFIPHADNYIHKTDMNIVFVFKVLFVSGLFKLIFHLFGAAVSHFFENYVKIDYAVFRRKIMLFEKIGGNAPSFV